MTVVTQPPQTKRFLTPWRVFGVLSFIVGTMAWVSLTQYAFEFGLSPTAQLILHSYNWFMAETLGRIEPFIGVLLGYVSGWIQIELALYPHWKDVLVVISLYLGSTLRNMFSIGFKIARLATTAVAAVSIALVASIGAGIVTLHGSNHMMTAAIPITGILCFELIKFVSALVYPITRTAPYTNEFRNWWSQANLIQRAGRTSKRDLFFVGFASLVPVYFYLAGEPTWFSAIPSPSIALLITFAVALATFNVGNALYTVLKYPNQAYASRVRQFTHNGSFRVARLMFLTLIGAGLFLGLDAGQELLR